MSASAAKTQFERVLEDAIRGRRIVITKRGVPKAVLISIEEFNKLEGPPKPKLNLRREEFDALYASMQTPKARAAARALFRATPKQLGQPAVAAARKRD